MANGTAQAESAIATYRVLRELGRRSQRSYAAVRGDGSIVVLQRFTRDSTIDAALVSAEEMAILLRDARCLAKNWHPNIARVRNVDLAGDVLEIATELVEGVTLEELFALAAARRVHLDEPILSHAVVARILLDVLAGLSALHGLRDGINAPLSAFHGELCPANVVVGKDGVARIVSVLRPRPVRLDARSEALGYASPETIAAELEQDARVDIYAAGVMLWEALVERRLYDETSPSRIAQRQRAEDIPSPNARLAEVAMRALAFDPALRFRTAQDMAANIRALAGTVAQGSFVAQLVNELAGDRIRARRAELDPLGRHRSLAPTRSGTHVRAAAPTVAAKNGSIVEAASSVLPRPSSEPHPSSAAGSRTSSGEVRIALPSAPDVETSYAPRPVAPRHALAPPPPPSRTSQGPLFPAHVLPLAPLAGSTTTSSLPPASEDDDELPGPRESTPDDDYLEQLAAAIRGGRPDAAAELLDVADFVEDDDVDDNALTIARDVQLSEGSLAAPMPAPATPEVAAPTPSLPAPSFPDLDQLTTPVAPAPSSVPGVVATSPRAVRQPSTRTPFVVDVIPEAIATGVPADRAGPRRILPLAVAAVAAGLVLAGIGVTIASRSAQHADATTAAPDPGEAPRAVTPPPAVDPLPPGAPASAPPGASAPPPASHAVPPRAPAKKRSVYDPSAY